MSKVCKKQERVTKTQVPAAVLYINTDPAGKGRSNTIKNKRSYK